MGCKYQEIAQQLQDKILCEDYPANTMLPTEAQLCQTYQVSRQTIRTALKCLADRGLIQRHQGSGSRVCDLSAPPVGRRKTVAIITTYISDYIFPAILREAEAVLSANNCSTLLYATSNQHAQERRILQTILEEDRIDGLLVEGTKTALPNPNLELYRALQKKGIPIVFFNGAYDDLDAVKILDDNQGGARQLVEYLIAQGHRQLAGMFKSDDFQGNQRFAGYAAALCDHGLLLDDRHVFWYRTEEKNFFTPESSLWDHSLRQVLTDCTAVVCYNDEAAAYLVQCLSTHGIKVPAQLAVVSFDNSLYSRLSTPQITSLSHGAENVGRLAAESLLLLFKGQKPKSRLLSWCLMERESSRAPKDFGGCASCRDN